MPDDKTPLRPSRRAFLGAAGGTAIGLSLGGGLGGCSPALAARSAVNFYNWNFGGRGQYVGKTTLSDFGRATGSDVTMTTFSSNDELYAALMAGNHGFDVIMPYNGIAARLADAGKLMVLDHARIPNMRNLAPEFLHVSYDPDRRYSMPYSWLVLGIGYRKSKVDVPPDSWQAVFDSDRHTGRIGLLNEGEFLLPLVAKYLGHPAVGMSQATIEQVTQLLIRQKPHVMFHDDDGQDLLLAGKIDLVVEYNGDIAQAMHDRGDTDIGFVVPKEGSLLTSDCLCIPAGAPHPDAAHAFINFVLDARAGKGIIEAINYPTPNAAARALMPGSYRNDPVMFPNGPGLLRSEYATYDAAEHDRIMRAMSRIAAAGTPAQSALSQSQPISEPGAI